MVSKRPYRSVDMSLQNTLHFISEVKLHRCLWDHTHEDYKHKAARDKAWESLSISLGYSADDLVGKWQSLRSSLRQYRSAVRRRAKEGGDGADKLQVVTWPYYSAMSFTNAAADDDVRVISLPARLVPDNPQLPKPTVTAIRKNEPNRNSIVDEQSQIPDYDSSEEYEPPTNHVPAKILTSKPASTHDLAKKRRLIELSSKPSITKPPAPTTSRRIPKEPEFVAIKVEAIDPTLPVEQTFNGEPHSCSTLSAQDVDDVYGHSIALQMKQFSPKTKRKLQIQIHELISKAQKQAFEKDFGYSFDSS
ncbi:uncharacterized protein LOC118505386 isoform X2 [Anopheles stephensi]|uniref:uncharacterized protein LOC118505386 isoform X2 n=1 Tax=Anopheles stephensi TaxID=30069 RepID=UPI0016587A5B|nr:uncharacterized protein LOC118505386 isoform X2 [Anopheles stephensi]